MGRDTTKLHPRLREKVSELRTKCEKAGLKIGISECFRTVEEQDALYAQGRTKPGKIVTNARGGSYSSMHQWGVAFDFYRNDGKGAYNTSGKFFEKVGSIGKSIGLEWGGDWKSFKDLPHFQLPDWGSTSATLKSKFGNPTNFIATWSNPPKKLSLTSEIKYQVNVKTTLRLRNRPSLTSSIITKMPAKAIFVATGEEQNGFLKGTYGKKMGWASKKYLTRISK